MNPEKPWGAGERKSNVVNLAEERARREEENQEVDEIREQGAESLDHFDFSNLPILPPITPEELDNLPPFNLPRNEN